MAQQQRHFQITAWLRACTPPHPLFFAVFRVSNVKLALLVMGMPISTCTNALKCSSLLLLCVQCCDPHAHLVPKSRPRSWHALQWGEGEVSSVGFSESCQWEFSRLQSQGVPGSGGGSTTSTTTTRTWLHKAVPASPRSACATYLRWGRRWWTRRCRGREYPSLCSGTRPYRQSPRRLRSASAPSTASLQSTSSAETLWVRHPPPNQHSAGDIVKTTKQEAVQWHKTPLAFLT